MGDFEEQLNSIARSPHWELSELENVRASLIALQSTLKRVADDPGLEGRAGESAREKLDALRKEFARIEDTVERVNWVVGTANRDRSRAISETGNLPSTEIDPFWRNAVTVAATVTHPVLGPLASDTALGVISNFLGGQREQAAKAAVEKLDGELRERSGELRSASERLPRPRANLIANTPESPDGSSSDGVPGGPRGLPPIGSGSPGYPSPGTTLPTPGQSPSFPHPSPGVVPPPGSGIPAPGTIPPPGGSPGDGGLPVRPGPTPDGPGGVLPGGPGGTGPGGIGPGGIGTGGPGGTGPGGTLPGGPGGTGGLVSGGAGAAAMAAGAKLAGGAGLGGFGGAAGARTGSGAGAGAGVRAGGLLGQTPGAVGAGAASGSSAASAGGSGNSGGGGRPGAAMMGAPGATGSSEKQKRSGLGFIAPRLEDDEELGPRAKGASSGSRDDYAHDE